MVRSPRQNKWSPGDATDAVAAVEERLSVVSAEVDDLAREPVTVDRPVDGPGSVSDTACENRLVHGRLGMAGGLFAALRAKHPASAAHCLRVALTCSSWAIVLELDEFAREVLEIAALLHDVGKIGVPDHVLLKPGSLTSEEALIMRGYRKHGRDILSCCGASPEVVSTVYYATAWFDGQTGEFDRHGRDLPLGSRMLLIADAYDSMTSEQPDRRRHSRERAVSELFQGAGVQFDPDLVREFARFLDLERGPLNRAVVSRWLSDLDAARAGCLWSATAQLPEGGSASVGQMFHEQLLDTITEGVLFVDAGLQIQIWNRAAELLTGRSASTVVAQRWSPALLELRDENYKPVAADRCPVIHALHTGLTARRRLFLTSLSQQQVFVDLEVVSLRSAGGTLLGVTVLLRDASIQSRLERQVQTLNERVALDGLTKVANRAEFDRVHRELTRAHFRDSHPYRMVMCDLDHFKRINDTYGHPAGDEALIAFAASLKQHCRQEDLVARYGGEEFVMLFPDCDGETAADRTEIVRESWAEQPQAALGGQHLTASFGVAELELGDTPEAMLARADRALLQAKNDGRNTVVRLGARMRQKPAHRRGWFSWWSREPAEPLLERRLTTDVPLRLALDKVRGFAEEHHAELQAAESHRVAFLLKSADILPMRRRGDRPWVLETELLLEERTLERRQGSGINSQCTFIDVVIRPRRGRDGQRRDAKDRAEELLLLIKSYLMAQELAGPTSGRIE